MKLSYLKWALALSFLLFIACGEEEKEGPDKPGKDSALKDTLPPADQNDGPDNMLWEISGENGSVYLLGSIHFADDTVYPLDDEIMAAYNNSEAIAVEVDATKIGLGMISKFYLKGGKKLKDFVSEKAYDSLVEAFESYGMPEMMYESLKPGYAFVILTAKAFEDAGFLPESGIDMFFMKMADSEGREIIELEGLDRQIALLEEIFNKYGHEFIEYTIEDLENLKEEFSSLLDSWKNGEADSVVALIGKAFEDNPEFLPIKKRMINDRNIEMANKIEEFLESGRRIMIIVGAAHIPGEGGILELLGESGGYEIKQL